MELQSFEAVMRALNVAGARCILVGGMAVVAHGHGRMTHDMDLVVDLQRDNVRRVFEALATLGYRPLVPVTAEGFADPAMRRSWIDHKNMTVLNFHSDSYRATPVDVFVEEPFDFETTYENAVVADVHGVEVRIVDLPTLIAMKEEAGRAIDLDDARHLRLLGDDEDDGADER
ncbi:hypothetical protein GF314_15195 [bacterium]|nr:hypothetical protein [bacterium]